MHERGLANEVDERIVERNKIPGRNFLMRLPVQVTRIGLGFLAIVTLAASAFPQQGTPSKTAETSKSVKAESVTINMPEGMTKDQADAILNEL